MNWQKIKDECPKAWKELQSFLWRTESAGLSVHRPITIHPDYGYLLHGNSAALTHTRDLNDIADAD